MTKTRKDTDTENDTLTQRKTHSDTEKDTHRNRGREREAEGLKCATWRQGAMAFDEVKKAVVKATSLEHGPPKEKHVQFMLQALKDGHGTSAREILLEVWSVCG